MGFKDKWAAAFGMAPVDYTTEIGRQLEAGDAILAHAQVIPSAYEGTGSSGGAVGNRLFGKAVDAVWNAASKQRHVSGEEGSIAQSLPREAAMAVAAFTTSGLSLWNFGPYGSTAPGERILSIPRERVVGVEDTGQRAQGGVPVARVSFDDGSFFDYRLMSKPGEEFWSALRSW